MLYSGPSPQTLTDRERHQRRDDTVADWNHALDSHIAEDIDGVMDALAAQCVGERTSLSAVASTLTPAARSACSNSLSYEYPASSAQYSIALPRLGLRATSDSGISTSCSACWFTLRKPPQKDCVALRGSPAEN